MTIRCIPALAALCLAMLAGPALAQSAVSAAPVGGTSGAASRPGWSAGQAPSSSFNSTGRPVTRNEAIRQRAAAARAQAGQVATTQPLRRTSSGTAR